jgi:hypothetical protein
MAKKKELPKAQLGSIIKGVKALYKGAKTGAKAVKETYKASKVAEPVASKSKKSMSDWAKQGTPKPSVDPVKPVVKTSLKDKAKNIKKKASNLSGKQKLAIGAGGATAVGGYKYLNRDRRTLKD